LAKTTKIKRVHFIGIGGSGMSGIALVAHNRGIRVTGSDLKESRYMRALLRAGVKVNLGHDVANVADPSIDVVVASSAIPFNNPEYEAALAQGLEIWPRARMLAYLGKGLTTLAVAGTHGKTTTSAMLASALDRLGADPTFLVGGVVDGYDSTARAGHGSHFVVEADESDGSFTWLDPALAIITNIEVDHLDHYSGLEEIIGSFESFLNKMTPQGDLIIWNETQGLAELTAVATAKGLKITTYGQAHDTPDLPQPHIICEPKDIHSFDVVYPNNKRVTLTLATSPGIHNMLNATAVMAALDLLRFNRQKAAEAVSQFTGVKRRFDLIGKTHGITVIDDYGHHPTEINATLKAASELGYTRVHVLFQPHRYTRTDALLPDFATSFDHADTVSFMDIYSAGEAPIPGVNGEALVDALLAHNPATNARFIRHRAEVPTAMAQIAQPGDLIITMGAGDVTALAPLILQALKEQLDPSYNDKNATAAPTNSTSGKAGPEGFGDVSL